MNCHYLMMTTHTPNHDAQIDDAIRRVRGGDAGAFEVVVRKWERSLRAWLAACGPPGVDVDEVAQRSFIAAFSRLDEYRTGTDFGAWLFTIARFQLKTEATRLRRVADYHARYGLDLLQRELDRRSNEGSGTRPGSTGAFEEMRRVAGGASHTFYHLAIRGRNSTRRDGLAERAIRRGGQETTLEDTPYAPAVR